MQQYKRSITSEFRKITSKTTKAKLKKKRAFLTLLFVSDQEILIRAREQANILFLLRSVMT